MGNKIKTEADRRATPQPPAPLGVTRTSRKGQRVSLERIADALDSAQVDVSLVDVAAAVGRLCHRGALVEREGWFEATGRGS